MEGFGSILSGFVGSGGATTSYSQNVGAIGFTKVFLTKHLTKIIFTEDKTLNSNNIIQIFHVILVNIPEHFPSVP
jgi:xanthine/uracil permease